MLADLFAILTFRSGYNASLAVAGTGLLGVAGGVTGVFAMLRNRALISDTLAHATLPGVCVAFLVGAAVLGLGASGGGEEAAWRLPVLLLGATISGVLGVLAVQWLSRVGRLTEDASMAAVLSVFFGAGVVLASVLQRLPVAGQAGIDRFIYGQTASMRQLDVWVMAGAALVALVVVALLYKELRLVCFDRAFAGAQRSGPRAVALVDLVLLAVVVVVTVVGLQAVGLILIVSLLITPAAASRFWSDRLWTMLLISAVVGGLSGMIGAAISGVSEKVPAGPAIVLVATAIFFVSMFIAPKRGVLARSLRQLAHRLRVAQEHALRATYERAEQAQRPVNAGAGGVAGDDRRAALVDEPLHAGVLASWLLRWRGLARSGPTGLVLTPHGARESARVTRVHRLWEQYLISAARHDPSHVDDPADLIEHALSPEIVASLEREVALGGGRIPASPHALGADAGAERRRP
jgi:manganese/zinc/iron transport system permease protein